MAGWWKPNPQNRHFRFRLPCLYPEATKPLAESILTDGRETYSSSRPGTLWLMERMESLKETKKLPCVRSDQSSTWSWATAHEFEHILGFRIWTLPIAAMLSRYRRLLEFDFVGLWIMMMCLCLLGFIARIPWKISKIWLALGAGYCMEGCIYQNNNFLYQHIERK